MSLGVVVCVASFSRHARADEPFAATEPHLLDETAEVTSVVDAFDRDDPFDLHIYAGFTQRWKRADIHRETALNQPGLTTGGFVANTENIARFSEDTSILNVGADIGLFRDLALTFRLPIILSDSRSLGDLDGSTKIPSASKTRAAPRSSTFHSNRPREAASITSPSVSIGPSRTSSAIGRSRRGSSGSKDASASAIRSTRATRRAARRCVPIRRTHPPATTRRARRA